MSSDEDLATWILSQGGRGAMNTDVLQGENAGGGFKKQEIAHILITIAKTNEKRKEGTANWAILKSRVGDAGVTFKDCPFDNGNMVIHVPSESSDHMDDFIKDKQLSH